MIETPNRYSLHNNRRNSINIQAARSKHLLSSNDKRNKEFVYIIDLTDNKHFGKIVRKTGNTGELII